jgi:hypothetical protein
MKPVIFDFDNSVLPVATDEVRIPLQDWQDKIRFGSSINDFRALENALLEVLPAQSRCFFMGSGDYHHVSLVILHFLSMKISARGPVDVIVCDNHTDNMRYLFGIHCGSWISWASKMEFIRKIYVIGITSNDVTVSHSWENRLSPFLKNKLEYWSIGKNANWLNLLGLAHCHRHFASAQDLLEAFFPLINTSQNIYLSIDKDVFHPDVVKTNWDQGVFMESHMQQLIRACEGKLIAADITGEVSFYTHTHWLKKFMSRRDKQESIDVANLHSWQIRQQAMNKNLLAWLIKAMEPKN